MILSSALINTPLQRGGWTPCHRGNRFSGLGCAAALRYGTKTAKAVHLFARPTDTLLNGALMREALRT